MVDSTIIDTPHFPGVSMSLGTLVLGAAGELVRVPLRPVLWVLDGNSVVCRHVTAQPPSVVEH
jgi:hypothetical protein